MAKHHDGFCMWDTATTDYKITSPRCPFHADPRADTDQDRCATPSANAGLSTGIYFSKADWHSPNYWLPDLPPGQRPGPQLRPRKHPGRVEEVQGVHLEADRGTHDRLRPAGHPLARRRQRASAERRTSTWTAWPPWRAGISPASSSWTAPCAASNENYITPEGEIPDHYLPYPWETCMTMGTSWTYKPNDQFKSAGTLIRNLCRIVARNGNYLIGIGPDAKRRIRSDRLRPAQGNRRVAQAQRRSHLRHASRQALRAGRLRLHRASATAPCTPSCSPRTTGGMPETVTLPGEIAGSAVKAELLGGGALTLDGTGLVKFPESIRSKPPCGHAWAIKLTQKTEQRK